MQISLTRHDALVYQEISRQVAWSFHLDEISFTRVGDKARSSLLSLNSEAATRQVHAWPTCFE